jgi:hypothetical protein
MSWFTDLRLRIAALFRPQYISYRTMTSSTTNPTPTNSSSLHIVFKAELLSRQHCSQYFHLYDTTIGILSLRMRPTITTLGERPRMLSILGGVHTSVRVEARLQPRLRVVRLSCRHEGKTLMSLRTHLVNEQKVTLSTSFRCGFVYGLTTCRRTRYHKGGSITTLACTDCFSGNTSIP